jgi:gamma-glutamylcyclotransferase (GGCT)/AIG2-like uncharacterized protein YtfP
MARRLRFVFAYGSLQIPTVMRAVTGADYPARQARLEGYARYRLRGRPYPGLRRKAGALTDGVLYGPVNAAALKRLDAFEADFYRRKTLLVHPEAGAPVASEVYVVPPAKARRLLGRAWDLEVFRRTALREFLARCRRLS